MIRFVQLRISNDGKKLYVEFAVNTAREFDNVKLDSIAITTQDYVSEANPDSFPEKFIYKKVYGENDKEDYIVLDRGVFDAAWNNTNQETGEAIDGNEPIANTSYTGTILSNNMFFVYVKCKDAPIIGCPPCRLDELTTLGVTFDEAMLHQKVLGYTNELVADCTVPQGFTDFILLWQAFKSAIEAEHYIMAIKYWKMLFEDYGVGSGGYIGNKSNCGCHGKNSL